MVADQALSVADMLTEAVITALEYLQLASFPFRSVPVPTVLSPFQVCARQSLNLSQWFRVDSAGSPVCQCCTDVTCPILCVWSTY